MKEKINSHKNRIVFSEKSPPSFYIVFIIMIIVAMVLFFVLYLSPKRFDTELFIFFFFALISMFIFSIQFTLYLVIIHNNNIISIPGYLSRRLEENSYRASSQWGSSVLYCKFTISNIKKCYKVINAFDIDAVKKGKKYFKQDLRMNYATNIDKLICIEFIEPLFYWNKKNKDSSSSIDKIYFSIKEPDNFISYINSLCNKSN